ncbi:hypothetical protein HSX37_07230|uniref:Oxaloacetate decarboxylase, gamma chain n=1 Tax=Dendrosporobacter quercicolus TaxID=146817 RepID=A0A1G9VPV6_9FIRM|nr:hypothetical protein [Dendrosporobacter quercicolus]NSL47659.1 hypothetical protein [Dendrosporobacter quercicolus DSM 1736]NSL47837.1 hypothetical protein [Dendrosporobacter quercicolus DSM 1736]SDM74166.1 hypothetical protein SAMN04488502_1072 [Dendrosporobacter quercicolus]
MEDAVSKAITLGTVALPTMFFVIGVFILATKALHAAFPVKAEDEE